MKKFYYNNVEYVMVKKGYGQYSLNGYHCTDSLIWDWCDDEEDEEKHIEALQRAESFVRNASIV